MKNMWDRYSNFDIHSNLSVFLCIFLFFISGISGLAALTHPWLLIISEFIKIQNIISLPSFLTSDKLLKWEFQGINKFFEHEIFYSQNKINYNFKEKQYIKCLMPHGIVPFTIGCLWGDPNEEDAFGWKNNVQVTTHQFYQFPFISNYGKAMGIIPSDYNQMENVLKTKKSLTLYPGGIREMFACSHKKDVIVIKKRKGIFHLALKNGISLLPVYTFGITSLYERSGVKITIPFFFKNDKDSVSWYYGKYCTPFPMRKKLITVVGNPVEVKKIENVTIKDIDELRDRYITEIKTIYKKWCSTISSDKCKKLKIK